MKSFLVSLIIVFTLVSSTVSAQSFYAVAFAGFNGSQIDGDNLLGYDKLNGTIGGFVAYETGSWADWALELRYIGKGRVKYADIEAGETDYFRVDLHYLEMPVYLRIPMHKEYKLYLEPGLAVGYLLNQSYFEANGKMDLSEVGKVFKEAELSSLLGVSYLHEDHWLFRFRWEGSLLPIGKGENNSLDTRVFGVDRRNYSRLVELTVGYQF